MFYSHEVLTSRKYGVATVWLVATLGSKSSLKRINRKQILDVDVTKACQTIVDPVAPMALRLQSNLLYGVSRVYLQQCGYVLSDAQNAHNTIRMLLRTVEDAALDPEAGKARREQLVLSDDPSFLPDFAAPPPELFTQLENDFSNQLSHFNESQSLTPFGSQQSSQPSHVAGMGLVFPSSSPDRPGQFQVKGDDGQGIQSVMLDIGDLLDLEEPDFMFSADGDLVQLTPAAIRSGTPAMPGGTGASARVRREHEEGRQGDAQMLRDQMDDDLPIYGDDIIDGEAFPTRDSQQPSSQSEVIIESTSTVAAPMRRKKRTMRTISTDTAVELRSKDLADWNTKYLDNMAEAVRARDKKRVLEQAKKNAEHYLWGAGLGGIAQQMVGAVSSTPFDRFIGDNLFELFTGVSRRPSAGSKRDRDSGIDEATQDSSRRVRQKTSSHDASDQLGRGEQDEGIFLGGGDDDDIEFPRESATALDDHDIFSAMPWNTSASIRGSSVLPLPRSARPGMLSDHTRPGSRMVSASPLQRHSQPARFSGLDSLQNEGEGYAGDEFAGLNSDMSEVLALTHSQASVHVREALSAEGENFVAFVADAVSKKRDADDDGDYVTFAELLPPTQNNSIIACQGLMMVLTLGTKGLLKVQQIEAFGDIRLKLTDQAGVPGADEIRGGVEDDDDMDADVEVDEPSHFAEQFDAGLAVREDDHDSLYDD